MENLILGWYILVATGSVLLLTLFASLQYFGTLVAPLFGLAGDRLGHRNVLCAMRAVYATLATVLATLAFSGWLSPPAVFVHRRAGRAGAPVGPRDARRAGRRDHPVRPPGRRHGRLAHHRRFRAHRRVAGRRGTVRRVRHGAGLSGHHAGLHHRLPADAGRRRAAPLRRGARRASRSGATCARGWPMCGTRRRRWRRCCWRSWST